MRHYQKQNDFTVNNTGSAHHTGLIISNATADQQGHLSDLTGPTNHGPTRRFPYSSSSTRPVNEISAHNTLLFSVTQALETRRGRVRIYKPVLRTYM